jgi:hypothetical protein
MSFSNDIIAYLDAINVQPQSRLGRGWRELRVLRLLR